MTKVKNDWLRHSLMGICFGSAMLILLVKWQTSDGSATTRPKMTRSQPVSGEATPQRLTPYSSPLMHESQSPNSLHLIVDLSDRRVYVYQDTQLKGSYPVAIGQPGWETPTGSFQVLALQKHPAWRHPITGAVVPSGSNNPLGSRWIGFWSNGRHQIGFHGTPDASLVGQAVSHGCLRMRNSDIEALFEQVFLGTPVTVKS